MTVNLRIFATGLDDETVKQIYEIAYSGVVDGDVAIMPDAHAGAGCVIGTVCRFTGMTDPENGVVVPNVVGVDIGCFRGDTKIPLLNGTQRTLKELVGTGSFYVYSMNKQLQIVPGKAVALKTRSNAKVIKVVISGGDEIICTPDHKFMLIDGSYKEARDLKPKDSLMPLYRTYQTRDGYESVYSVQQKAKPTHKLVAEHFHGKIDSEQDAVHHIDLTWYNNDPNNLEVIDKCKHSKLHRELNCSFTNEEFQEKKMKTINERGYYYSEEFTAKKKEVAIENIKKYMEENPEDFKRVSEENGRRGSVHFSKWNTENNSKPVTCEICGKEMKKGGLGNHMKFKHPENTVVQNHKVLYIEDIESPEDVYCLNVEEYHNFALSSGVFVHNCGVFGVQIPDIEIDFEALDQHLKNRVPLGMRHRVVAPRMTKEEKAAVDEAVAIQEKLGLTRHSATVQVGTLGGGNHFIEIAQGKNCKWVLIHSGSRNFGLTIAKYYQAMAKGDKRGLAGLKMKEGGADYLHDMRVAQRFAKANRSVIMRIILEFLGVEALYSIDCVHNFIGDDGICRKGAISAYKGEPVLIPLNMRDGTVIGFGKGNPEFLNSAPHGAGRAFGRGQMKRRLASGELTVEGFKKEMEGIYTTTADASTIDESPMAYKPFEQIKEYLEQTVTISEVVKPIYNLKGSE